VRRWPPSAAQTARAVFPHAAFTKTHDLRCKERQTRSGPYLTSVRLRPASSILGRRCTGFSLSELIHLHHPYSSGCPPLPSCLRLPPSPTHSGRRSLGHVTFITLQVLWGSPTTNRASLAISLALIGLLTPVLPGDSASSPEVTRCSSVPCRPQTPWCGG
jgi:hypothetical protein